MIVKVMRKSSKIGRAGYWILDIRGGSSVGLAGCSENYKILDAHVKSDLGVTPAPHQVRDKLQRESRSD